MIVYGVLPVLVFCSVPINQAANANGGRTRLDWPVSSVDAAQVTDVPAQRRQKWNGLTEFKREFTDKGEPPEKTQSTLKIDWYPIREDRCLCSVCSSPFQTSIRKTRQSLPSSIRGWAISKLALASARFQV